MLVRSVRHQYARIFEIRRPEQGLIYSLSASDVIDVADVFVRSQASVYGEALDYADELTKSLLAAYDERLDITESVSLAKIAAAAIAETIDIVDNLGQVIHTANLDELAFIFDELTKVRYLIYSENLDISDLSSGVRAFTQSIIDVIDVFDDIVKSLLANVPDSQDITDDLTKFIAKIAGDALDVLDTATSQRLVTVILSEMLDVRDELVKSMQAVLDDSMVGVDALTKMLAKVLVEQVDISDSFDAVVNGAAAAIVAVAQYLDTMLTSTRDSLRRVGSSDLMKRVGSTSDIIKRIKDIKGFRR